MSLYTNEAGHTIIAHFSYGDEKIYLAHHIQYLMDRQDVFWIVDGDTGEVLYLSSDANAVLSPVA